MSDQISYYQKVQPFARQVNDIDSFINRRAALYNHLGIVPKFLKGQSILEFGPGFGENGILPLLQCPSRYLMVDSSAICLDKARARLVDFTHNQKTLETHLSSIENFQSIESFDLVICESVIPREPNPLDLLSKVAARVSVGGVLIITCQDSVSTFAELLRRLLALLLVDPDAPLQMQLTSLEPIFSSHLKTIDGMNRSVSDWILDNLLRPWQEVSFSISDAIEALQFEFDLLGSSPRFITDSRWYRVIGGDDTGFNDLARKAYFENLHNFLNYREWSAPISTADNQLLLALCTAFFYEVKAFEIDRDVSRVHNILLELTVIIKKVSLFSSSSAAALGDFHHVVSNYLRTGVLHPFQQFTGLFGRGQQHVSFLRRR